MQFPPRLLLTAEESRQSFLASACNTVTNSFYVDDGLVSLDGETELIDNARQVIDICKSGGFNFTKLLSPSKLFMSSFSEEKLAISPSQLINSGPSVEKKALGIIWN